jgi:hypothetical protein
MSNLAERWGSSKNETPNSLSGAFSKTRHQKAASQTRRPEWRFWSHIPDTETGRYPRNAPSTAWF